MTGRLDDQPVVIKQVLTDDAPQIVAAISAELLRIAPRFETAPLRVAALCGSWPECGLYCKIKVSGDPMTRTLPLIETPRRRLQLVTRAGAWLARYSEDDRGPAPLKLTHHRGMVATAPIADLPAALRDPAERLRVRLLDMADRMTGGMATYGASHGDFVPGNLMVDRGDLWGIDIGTGLRLPIALELARFLNWAWLAVPDPAHAGLGSDDPAAGDRDVIGLQTLLQAPDDAAALRFFDGFALLRLCFDMAMAPVLLSRLDRRIAQYLALPREMTHPV